MKKHDAYSKETKPEDMSEAVWVFSKEENMDKMEEAVTKARIMYRFDGGWFFRQEFLTSIAVINEDDVVWKDYLHIHDNNTLPPEAPHNTALFRIASAIMYCITILRRTYNQPKLTTTEVGLCIEAIRALFQMYVMDCFDEVFSEEELTKWGRTRKNWLPLEVAVSNYLGQEETLNKDKGD